MIREHSRFIKKAQQSLDIVVTPFSFLITYAVRIRLEFNMIPLKPFSYYLFQFWMVLLLWVFLLHFDSAYRLSVKDTIWPVLVSDSIGGFAFMALLFVFKLVIYNLKGFVRRVPGL